MHSKLFIQEIPYFLNEYRMRNRNNFVLLFVTLIVIVSVLIFYQNTLPPIEGFIDTQTIIGMSGIFIACSIFAFVMVMRDRKSSSSVIKPIA